jgi:Zn-dependent M28 family amino/carboxypeptidase
VAGETDERHRKAVTVPNILQHDYKLQQIADNNGDGSTFGSDLSGPSGSGFIEGLFNDFFASQNQASEPIPFDGRSDYVAFTDAGIPAGGIFTGAEKNKTHEEFLLFGGTEGQPLTRATTRRATR